MIVQLILLMLPWVTHFHLRSLPRVSPGPIPPTPSSCAGEQLPFHPMYSCDDGTLLFSSGRACHVTGENLLDWNTFRLSGPIKSGDVMGCGWVKGEDGNKGVAYFTLNGEKFKNTFTDVPGETIPFLVIQKKVSQCVTITTICVIMIQPCVCIPHI